MKTILGTVALTLTAVVASGAPLPGFSLTAQTPRFSFYTRGQRVDVAKVEQTVARFEQTLGHQIQGKAEYYRYDSAQEVAAGTGHYAAGVTYAAKGEVHSIEACHDHELVHLVAGQMGDPGSMFQEGLAVALGNKGKWQGQPVDKTAKRANASIDRLLNDFDSVDSATAYAVSGSFVQHLIKVHGVAKISELFRACTPGTDVRTAFGRTFGMTVEQATARWQATL